MVIPLRDSVRGRSVPWLTYSIIALNTVVFAVEAMGGRAATILLRTFALVPAHLLDPVYLWTSALWPVVTLVTSTFLHGSWLHLIGNMVYLWVFADNVEDRLGKTRFAVFYTLCGALAGLAHALANPTTHVPTIGASGAVAGALGAYVLTFPKAKVLTLLPLGVVVPAIRIPVWVYLGVWFLLQVYSGLMPLWAQEVAELVAWWAHISGFLVGVALMRILEPPRTELT